MKIVLSAGFTADRIEEFEAKRVPVDSYALPSSLLRGAQRRPAGGPEDKPCAKAGRAYRPNPRLERVA